MREVIAAIAQGDNLVIGTNLSIAGTTVGEELSELNNSLNGIDIRLNSTSNQPEWSARGAGTWSPFSGGLNFVLGNCASGRGYPAGSYKYLNADGSYGEYSASNSGWITGLENSDLISRTWVSTGGTYYQISIEYEKTGYYIRPASYSYGASFPVEYHEAGDTTTFTGGYTSDGLIYLGETNPFE